MSVPFFCIVRCSSCCFDSFQFYLVVYFRLFDHDPIIHQSSPVSDLSSLISHLKFIYQLPSHAKLKLYVFNSLNDRIKIESDASLLCLSYLDIIYVYVVPDTEGSPQKLPLRINTNFGDHSLNIKSSGGSSGSDSPSSESTGSEYSTGSDSPSSESPESGSPSSESPHSPIILLVKARDLRCLITQSEPSICHCSRIIPLDESERTHRVSHEYIARLPDHMKFDANKDRTYDRAGKLVIQPDSINENEEKSITGDVQYVLVPQFNDHNPMLGLLFHPTFNHFFDNGMMWFESYDNIVYAMFHSTAGDFLFPERFPRSVCHGKPIIDYAVWRQCMYTPPEFFEFHRYLHVGPIQRQKKLALEALESHENEIQSV